MTFIRRGTFEQITASPAASVADAAKLRTPASYAKLIEKIAALEIADLKALDVRTIGDLRDLEVGSGLVGDNAEISEISIEKVAAVIAGYDFGLLKLISPRSMLKNWFPYFENRLPSAIYRPLAELFRKFL